MDSSGLVVIQNLALIDEKNGNKWLIKVDNGKLIIEPVEIEDKRDHKIKSILDDNICYNVYDITPGTGNVILILECSYYRSKINPYTFEKMIEVCCDMFFNWYNKNLDVIKDFDDQYDKESMYRLEDVCLGDITKVVDRELNIEDILKLIE